VAAQYRPMSVHILYKHLLEGQLSQCIHLLESSDVSGRFRPLSSIIWSWLRPVSGPSCNSFCLTFVHNTFTWATSETLSHHLLAAVHWNAATCLLQCIGMQPPACCSALECSHLLAAVHWNAATCLLQCIGMQPFLSLWSYLTRVNILWWYLKWFKSCPVDTHPSTPPHPDTYRRTL